MWQKVAKFKGAEYFRKALYINCATSLWCSSPFKAGLGLLLSPGSLCQLNRQKYKC